MKKITKKVLEWLCIILMSIILTSIVMKVFYNETIFSMIEDRKTQGMFEDCLLDEMLKLYPNCPNPGLGYESEHYERMNYHFECKHHYERSNYIIGSEIIQKCNRQVFGGFEQSYDIPKTEVIEIII